MTGPLVVLGVLSAVRRLAQPSGVASPLGPVGVLEHWLEPVVGDATAARDARRGGRDGARHGVRARSASAVAIALVGHRHRVRAAQARVARAEARGAAGARLRARARATSTTSMRSTTTRSCSRSYGISRNVLWRGIDVGIIDSAVRERSRRCSRARSAGSARSCSRGRSGAYAWVVAIGALAVLGAFTSQLTRCMTTFSTQSATTPGSCRRCCSSRSSGAVLVCWSWARVAQRRTRTLESARVRAHDRVLDVRRRVRRLDRALVVVRSRRRRAGRPTFDHWLDLRRGACASRSASTASR